MTCTQHFRGEINCASVRCVRSNFAAMDVTFTTGARQLVVQDAAVQIGMSEVSLSSFTPTTIFKIDGSFKGKLHTTFFTPALMYGITLSELKKTPVHSKTISHPSSAQGTSSMVFLSEKET